MVGDEYDLTWANGARPPICKSERCCLTGGPVTDECHGITRCGCKAILHPRKQTEHCRG